MIKKLVNKYLYKKSKFIAPRLDLEAETINDFDRESRKIINLINYTKESGTSYSGELYNNAYHTITIGDNTLKGQRNPELRLKDVPYDFTNKKVLDLGCNQGGMLHAIADKIKEGIGIDYDYKMINTANKIKLFSNNTHLNFFVFNLEVENLEYLKDFISGRKVDICFLLSICKWLKNWKELITFSKSISTHMLFETNGSLEQQEDQINYLKHFYNNVQLINEKSEDDPIQKNRKLLICFD